jgi:hypothetical protein
MRFGKLLAAAVVAGLSTSAFAVVQPTTYEDFTTNSDGRWTGVGNRTNPGVNDYGWSDTDQTGNTVVPASGNVSVNGELAGSVQRGNFSHYGFDTGAMLPTDVLHADGVYRYISGSGNLFLGFYNSADHITAGGDPRNFIGIQLDDSRAALYHNARSDHNDRTHNGPANVAGSGNVIPWSIDYNGAGQTTFTIGSDVNIVLNSGGGYFTGGGGPATVFDRFGIFPGSTSDAAGVIAIDDITFSSTRPVPEPASLGLLAVGSMLVLRRRK